MYIFQTLVSFLSKLNKTDGPNQTLLSCGFVDLVSNTPMEFSQTRKFINADISSHLLILFLDHLNVVFNLLYIQFVP